MGEDTPQVLMDPLVFMLSLLSMINAEYYLWRNNIPYAMQVTDELDYDEFNDTHLMPSFTTAIYVLPFLIYFHFSFALLYMMIFERNTYVRLALLLCFYWRFLSTLVSLCLQS